MDRTIPETDQWKLEGDCLKCRRHDYCKKPCHACKKSVHKMIAESMASAIDEKLGKDKSSDAE